jgi:RimJ/RimL family protein N-acetyltransferase
MSEQPHPYSIRHLTRKDWEPYRDFYKALENPSHFTGLTQGKNLDDPETYNALFAATIDGPAYVMFGAFHGNKMVGQTSLFFEDTKKGRHAVFAGSERADDYKGKGLGDLFYKTRLQYLAENNFTGRVTTAIRKENKESIAAARRNGFAETGEINEHGYVVLDLVRPEAFKGGFGFEVETGFGPETDTRMRLLFIITEPGNNEAANELIITALGENEKVPASAAKALPHGLINEDRTIPPDFREAIRAALEHNYLSAGKPAKPGLKAALDFLRPEPK